MLITFKKRLGNQPLLVSQTLSGDYVKPSAQIYIIRAMELTPAQLNKIKKTFGRGAFDGLTEEQARKVLNGAIEYYLTLANINIRLKREEANKNNESNL